MSDKPQTFVSSESLDSESTTFEPTKNQERIKVKWNRSTFYNATVIGICNLLAPGLWGAMNSLGAGGLRSSTTANTANALTFGLMFITCFFGSAAVSKFGIRAVLSFGTAGYAPYAAGLYCNSKFGNQWFVMVGAALCGLTAGVFWMAEAVIALSYPESYNKGRFLGYWMSYRVGGQIVGGAINLALNSKNNHKGAVSTNVYIIFIVLQGLGPFVAWLITPPEKVERTDGKKVKVVVDPSVKIEIWETLKIFKRPEFMLLLPYIIYAVFGESFNYTYIATYFTVRSRALGSFLSGIVAIIFGNLQGAFFDTHRLSNKTKARVAFGYLTVYAGGLWTWSMINQVQYSEQRPTYDWDSPGFGRAFPLYLFLVAGFQLNYIYLYYIIGNLARTPEEIVRLSALLRGTESAGQAIGYGVNSIHSLITVGSSAINFGLWGVALLPTWLVVKQIGVPNGLGVVEGAGYVTDQNSETETENEKEADARTRSSSATTF